ncbi:MAG: PilZ domain-containing protein [Desulfobacteraceae bacterium]
MASRRSYNRWKCMIPVDYVVNEKAHREFIHDISAKGVFIGCKAPPSAGDPIVLTFAWKQHYKSSGTVVRTDAEGFAVQFAQPIPIQ